MIHQILSYTAVAAGVLSGILWSWAATTVVKKGDARAAHDIFLGDVAIQSTFKEQSKLNKYAAFATAAAGAASGLAQLFSN